MAILTLRRDLFGQHLGDQILQGVQGLALFADEQAGVVGLNAQADAVVFVMSADRGLLLHLLQEVLQDLLGRGQQIFFRLLPEGGPNPGLAPPQAKEAGGAHRQNLDLQLLRRNLKMRAGLLYGVFGALAFKLLKLHQCFP